MWWPWFTLSFNVSVCCQLFNTLSIGDKLSYHFEQLCCITDLAIFSWSIYQEDINVQISDQKVASSELISRVRIA